MLKYVVCLCKGCDGCCVFRLYCDIAMRSVHKFRGDRVGCAFEQVLCGACFCFEEGAFW